MVSSLGERVLELQSSREAGQVRPDDCKQQLRRAVRGPRNSRVVGTILLRKGPMSNLGASQNPQEFFAIQTQPRKSLSLDDFEND